MHECEPKRQSTDCLTKDVKKQHYQRVLDKAAVIFM